jgi:sporulation protein YlmC with PRC-barrel domain
MKQAFVLTTAFSAALALGSAAYAQYNPPGDLNQPSPSRQNQDQNQNQKQNQNQNSNSSRNDQLSQQNSQMQMQLQRLSKLIDADVKGAQNNDDLGEIKNFAIDPNQGEVEFAILSINGKDIAVPWQAFQFRSSKGGDHEVAMLNVARDQLMNAPTLPDGQIDKLSDQNFSNSIYQHFGISRTRSMNNSMGGENSSTPNPQMRQPNSRDQNNPDSGFEETNPGSQNHNNSDIGNPNQNQNQSDHSARNRQRMSSNAGAMISAKDLLDSDVNSAQNQEDLGDVEDVLVDSNTGNIAFVVLSSGGFLGLGEDLRAVPIQSFNLRQANVADHKIALNVSKSQLENAPTFKKSDWSTMTANSNWTQGVYSHYGVQQPTSAYGYVPPQSGMGAGGDVNAVISNWPQAAQQAAQQMIQKYGQPDGVTPSMLTWTNKGQWARIIAFRDEVQHNFPMPHKDVLEESVYYKVPADKIDELSQFDGSVIVYRTDGLLSARCDSEPMNILALNLANDIVTGKRSADEARSILAQTAQQYQQGQSSQMTQQLQFQPQGQNRAA